MRPGPLTAAAVVFDLDGTLLDSYRAIARSLNHARQALGHEPLPVEQVRRHIGWGLEKLLAGFFAPAERERAKVIYRAHYAETCVAGTELLPHARETLADLDRRGFLLGVATNKPSSFSRDLLQGLGLLVHLDVVVGADQVKQLKPHPEMLERALADLGVGAGEAVYVGDMHLDLETARAASVRFLGVATGAESRFDLERAGAEEVLEHLGLLPARIEHAPAREAAPGRSPGGEHARPRGAA